MNAQTKLASFDVKNLAEKMTLAISQTKHSLKKINQTFFCSMCDAEMSQFIQPMGKTIQITVPFC